MSLLLETIRTVKITSVSIISQSSPLPVHDAPLDVHLPHPQQVNAHVLLVTECQFAFLSNVRPMESPSKDSALWLLPLSLIILRSTCKWQGTIGRPFSLLSSFPPCEHTGCGLASQWALRTGPYKAAENIPEQVFVWMYHLLPLGKHLGVEELGHLQTKKLPNCFLE